VRRRSEIGKFRIEVTGRRPNDEESLLVRPTLDVKHPVHRSLVERVAGKTPDSFQGMRHDAAPQNHVRCGAQIKQRPDTARYIVPLHL